MERCENATIFCAVVIMYNLAMGWKTMKVAVCDVCGHVWIPSVENPTLCASKKCRSTLWDKGGVDGRTREARNKKRRGQRSPKE
jgi:hypothetical protein